MKETSAHPRAETTLRPAVGESAAWLPDAPLEPRPVSTWLLECCFDLAVRALYRVEELLPSDYALEPGMLVVSNHQSDADVPIVACALCQRRGPRFAWPLPFCAGREDMLRPGFLGRLLAHWPAPLPALLARVPLGWLMRLARVRPLLRMRELSFGEALSACAACESAPRDAASVLNERGRREVTACLGQVPQTLDRLLAHRGLAEQRRTRWGLRRLARPARAALAPRLRADIERQLEQLAALLDTKRAVYVAPEGATSESGTFGRMRAGAWRLCRLAASPPAILPVGVSYDPFDAGRRRAVVRIGRPLRRVDISDRRRFDAALRREITSLCAVTPSHLVSRFLCAGPERFATGDFAAWLRHGAAAVARSGLTLDPVLEREAIDALAEQRLAWLARRDLVRADGDRWRGCWPRETAPAWDAAAHAVRYLDNALCSLVADRPRLAAELRP